MMRRSVLKCHRALPTATASSSHLFRRGSAACTMGGGLVNSCFFQHQQQRQISVSGIINPLNWFSSPDGSSARATNPNLEEELPEVFANQPEEIDDYIRPDKSIFETMEDWWDWGLAFMQPVELQISAMKSLRHDGLFNIFEFTSWGQVFVFYGMLMRLLSLIPALYSHRNVLRMNHIGTPLAEINNNLKKIKGDKTLSAKERKIVKDGHNRMKSALYKKHKCTGYGSFVQSITAPLMMTCFMGIRRMTMYDTEMEKAQFMWVTDLSMPDPTYALPAVCAGMFLMNFELNQRMQRGTRSAVSMYMKWGMRFGACCFVYFMGSQPSAMFAYWIGLSTAGMLQPLLLRNQKFRSFFQFPDPPQAAKGELFKTDLATPTLMQRLFSTKEQKKEMEKEMRQAREEAKKPTFEKIDDFDVVFDDDKKKK